MIYVMYQENKPATARVLNDAPEVTLAVAAANAPVVVRNVKKPEDLGGVPLDVLAALHKRAARDGAKLPRGKARVAKVVSQELKALEPSPSVRRRAPAKPGRKPRKGSEPRRVGMVARMEELALQGVPRDQAVAQIHKEFPQSRATGRDYYIARSNLRKRKLID